MVGWSGGAHFSITLIFFPCGPRLRRKKCCGQNELRDKESGRKKNISNLGFCRGRWLFSQDLGFGIWDLSFGKRGRLVHRFYGKVLGSHSYTHDQKNRYLWLRNPHVTHDLIWSSTHRTLRSQQEKMAHATLGPTAAKYHRGRRRP